MCKKHCKYREKIAFGAIYNHFFNPNGRVTLLRFIWGVFWAYPASFQGQVGGFVWQFTILVGLYWATSGLCSALQHIGSVGGLYVGLILAQVAILGHFKAMLGLSGVMCRRIGPLGGLC